MAQQKWLILPGEAKTIDIEIVRKLKVSLVAGQLDIIAHDEPGARVEVSNVSGRDLKVSITGDTLEVDHPQWRWDNFIDVFRAWRGKARADVSLLVPRDVALKLGVVSASAFVSGLTADAKLSTVSGEITLDTITGDLELNTVSGELSVRDHRGDVVAHSVSGDVMASGEINSLSVDGVSANVFLDIQGAPDVVKTNTVSGDVTLRLDENIGARYTVNTVSGVMHLDGSTIIRGGMGKTFTHTTGSLDSRWVDVNANSVSGNVSVVRKTADATTRTASSDGDADADAADGGAA